MRNELKIAEESLTDRKIISGSVVMVQSMDGNELQYDTLDATLDFGALIPTLFKPKDADGLLTSENQLFGVRPLIWILVTDPTLYKYGEEVFYHHDGNLIGKYYMTEMTRVGKTKYRIKCVSPIGLLANSQHYGGIYFGILFYDLVKEIIGGAVPFSVATELANQPIYGWLPVASRRENLHQALFAMGAAAQKDENGDLVFCPLSDETHTEIPDNRVYTNGSVSYPDAVTKVSISEHSFVKNANDETVTLFEGLVASERITTPSGVVTQGTVVLFNEPMHDLVVENGSIFESGVNYAVLSPAAECKLTGQKYTHTVRQVTRPETNEGGDTGTENKITVTDATLVSIANSENVANRLMSYYSSAKKVSADIVVESEKAGTAVQIADAFGDKTKGIIGSMDITMSNTLKAHAEIISDYSPGGAGNFYTNVDVLTSNGTWTVPTGVTRIRAAIIGGGSGGASGAQGGNGEVGQSSMSGSGSGANWLAFGSGGAGGKKGKGGHGGKILVTTIDVTDGQTFQVSIGVGGIGGVCAGTENASGTDGGDTTFGTYSSASGVRSATGYADLFGSTSYGTPGSDGAFDGSDGDSGRADGVPEVSGDSITINGVTYSSGAMGEMGTGNLPSGGFVIACGGNGGGAAAGSNGGNGDSGRADIGGTIAVGYAGAGGVGATSTMNGTDGTIPGSGGQGGNGGGGGGGGGSGVAYGVGYYLVGGQGGIGGLGSNGGNGANGCVLIYY